MLGKHHALQLKPKTTDELKVALQTMGRAATRTHQQGRGELHQVLDCLQPCVPAMVVTSSICSNSVHFQVCIIITSKLALFRATNRLPRNAEKLRLSWLKQHNFAIVRNVSIKLGGKMYISLLSSCVKFHSKIYTHCYNINKSQ